MYHRHANGGSAQWIANSSQEDGLLLTRSQVRRIARELDDSHYAIDPKDGPASQLMSILRRLSNEGHLQYTALFHEVTTTTMVAVSKLELRKKQKELREKMEAEAAEGLIELSQMSHHTEFENVDTTDCQFPTNVDVESSTAGGSTFEISSSLDKLSLQSILLGIKHRLKVGKKVLLAVAWTRADERRLFELFPEVLVVDVTFGTNDEARPQWGSAAFDGNMKVFTPVRAFLPSQCKWVFDWLFGSSMPFLLGKDTLSRIRLVLSDGNEKIYSAFGACQKTLYPNARHSLCIYHLVTKHLGEKIKPQLLDPSDTTCAAFIQTFKLWLFSWMQFGGVESNEEFEVSHSLLRQWLLGFKRSANRSLSHNAVVLEKFLVKSILPLKERWLYPLRMQSGLRTFNQKTSSPVEGVFHTVKYKSSKKVTPNMSIRESFQTQDVQVSGRMKIWTRNTFQELLSKHPLWIRGSITSDHVTTMGESLLQQRLSQRENYLVRVISSSCIEVVRKPGTAPTYCADCQISKDHLCLACTSTSPIPRFRRVRRVTFLKLSATHLVVTCDCCGFLDTGIPCQHMVKLFPVVRPHHFSIRWLKSYSAAFSEVENKHSWYKHGQQDQRLVISAEEHKEIISHASKDSDISMGIICSKHECQTKLVHKVKQKRTDGMDLMFGVNRF